MKRTIRLTESDLHRVIKESVKRILNEGKFVNNKKLSDEEQRFNYKGRERRMNSFKQSDQVQLPSNSEMGMYDVMFRKDLIRLKGLLRKYGVNPNSIHTRIGANDNQDMVIEIPNAQELGKSFMDNAKQLHFQVGRYDDPQRGALYLLYDNPENDDFEDGYSEHGIRVNDMGRTYQPMHDEPVDWYELNDKGYLDEY